jgi:hypothetical protein
MNENLVEEIFHWASREPEILSAKLFLPEAKFCSSSDLCFENPTKSVHISLLMVQLLTAGGRALKPEIHKIVSRAVL